MKLNHSKDQCIWVLSDVHAHLSLLEEHWRRRKPEDVFIILGDFINRGNDSLSTLRKVMEYSKEPHVYVLKGNHEDAMVRFLEPEYHTTYEKILKNPQSLYYQMAEEISGETPTQEMLKTRFEPLFSFLENLPLFLEDEHYIYVHAGIENRIDYHNSSKKSLIGEDYFYDRGHMASKIVVCGHFPVAMYRTQEYSNNVLIDLDKRIICVDGGLGSTTYGQLNCLRISEQKDPTYEVYVADVYEMRTIKQYQAPRGQHRGVCYPLYGLEMIAPSTSFSRVRIRTTSDCVYVKNEFLRTKDGSLCAIDDVPNNHLEVFPNEKIKILCDQYPSWVLAMKNGIQGWVHKDCIEGYE